MIRRLFVLTALLLALATVSLWPRTWRTADAIAFLTRSNTRYQLQTHPGGLDLTIGSHFNEVPPEFDPIFPSNPWPQGWLCWSHPWGGAETPVILSTTSRPPTTAISATAPTTASLYIGVTSGEATSITPFIWVPPAHNLLGFGYESTANTWNDRSGTPITQRMTMIAIPLWLVIMLLMLPALLALRRAVIRRRRLSSNRCVSCGYDLRGSPTQCPECGLPSSIACNVP